MGVVILTLAIQSEAKHGLCCKPGVIELEIIFPPLTFSKINNNSSVLCIPWPRVGTKEKVSTDVTPSLDYAAFFLLLWMVPFSHLLSFGWCVVFPPHLLMLGGAAFLPPPFGWPHPFGVVLGSPVVLWVVLCSALGWCCFPLSLSSVPQLHKLKIKQYKSNLKRSDVVGTPSHIACTDADTLSAHHT